MSERKRGREKKKERAKEREGVWAGREGGGESTVRLAGEIELRDLDGSPLLLYKVYYKRSSQLVHVCMYVCMYVGIYIYVYISLYIYMYMYVYNNI